MCPNYALFMHAPYTKLRVVQRIMRFLMRLHNCIILEGLIYIDLHINAYIFAHLGHR